MKIVLKFFTLFSFILFIDYSFAQNYQGPAEGSVPNGAVVSTGTFLKAVEIGPPREKGIRNVGGIEKTSSFIDFGDQADIFQSVYVEDKSVLNKSLTDTAMTVLLKSFKGLSMGNSIPPDPHIAVGPTHILATVNSTFAIWDKEGNLVREINPDAWFAGLVTNPGAFDPQIVYDHFDKKWIMNWDSQDDASQSSYFLLAISQDSIPLGTWYVWALPANQNGNTVVDNWADYPQLGFDKNAIYINSRQFTFNSPYQYKYNKIRIIKKSDLYNNPGGALSWRDIWDISNPVSLSSRPDIIIPAINYDPSADSIQYFLHMPRYVGANYITLFKISDPVGNPVLSGVNIPVQTYIEAPDANQLGGSTTLISANESGMKSPPIYRDGFLWGVHSVANPVSLQNSALRYYKIDVSSNTIVESATLGAPGYWYIFPNLAVDKDQNIAITYSRSGDDEYCGAYYTTRLKNDPSGLSDSKLLQNGKGNYVVTFSGTRNRWGDYMGIWLDPSDQNNIWMHTEYVESTNRWGTWIGKIRMVPFSGVNLFTSTPSIDFGNVEVNYSSDTVTAVLTNYGNETLIISDIPESNGPFHIVSNLTLPLNLISYDSVLINFVFEPIDTGTVSVSYPVNSNDPIFTSFNLKGKGYVIKSAAQNILYTSSGINNSGNLATLDKNLGIGSNIGSMLSVDIKSISINPKNNVIYGLSSTSSSSNLLRVNAEKGDAYLLHYLPIGDLTSIAFDTSGVLYAATRNGNTYNINLITGQADSIFKIPINILSLAFNPVDNELWASIFLAIGAGKDRIYKINKITGDTLRVGQTGFSVVTNGLVFDETGDLYGITGTTSQINNLISVNTSTGVGTLIGATGLKHLTDIASYSAKPTSVESDYSIVPSKFSINQNYPNPFNPSTTIEFALPVASQIKVKIYNLLGQVVKVLYDGFKPAGFHQVIWNSNDGRNKSASSGIYFYELDATGIDGRKFNQMKKMILIK